jgi:hypothetical protein
MWNHLTASQQARFVLFQPSFSASTAFAVHFQKGLEVDVGIHQRGHYADFLCVFFWDADVITRLLIHHFAIF